MAKTASAESLENLIKDRIDETVLAMEVYRDKESEFYEDDSQFRKEYDKAWDRYIERVKMLKLC